jgi:PIN domain nuclease of toxin-antitoxin system
VKGNLLDTNVILIAPVRPELLSPAVQKAVLNGPNFLSAISYWEVVIKSMKGKLNVGDPKRWWIDVIEELAADPLSLLPEHVGSVPSLPLIHKDPFNRILIAQAVAEGLDLVTTDSEIARYASQDLQVII